MLVFDLDGTLYNTAKYGVYQQLSNNIFKYLCKRLHITYEEAVILSRQYQDIYGSTVAGLKKNYDEDPQLFLTKVYKIDFSQVEKDLELKALLLDRSEIKIVFTNATQEYAEKLLGKMGILECFNSIFDITVGNYVSKIHPDAFHIIFKKYGIDQASNCTYIDDRASNLKVASLIGINTILCSSDENVMWIPKYENIYQVIRNI